MSTNIKNPVVGPDGKLIIPTKVEIDTTDAVKAAEDARKILDKTFGEKIFSLANIQQAFKYATEGLEAMKDSFGVNDKKWIEFSAKITKATADTIAEIEKIAGDNKVYSILEKSLAGGQSLLENLSESFGKKQKSRLKQSAGIFGAASSLIPDLKKVIDAEGFMDSFTTSLEGVGNAMKNLKGVVSEGAYEWLNWSATMLQSIAVALPLIKALTNTQIVAAEAQTTANTSAAASGAASSVASIPFVGWAMALAAIASVVAAGFALPKAKKMAMGGIAYGPTFAMVGEYAGASGNPEVIAPLNKLRSLIEPRDAYGSGQVEFKISGRELLGVLRKVNQVNERTR